MKYNKNTDTYLPVRLPIFMGYTIDERLREFRKVSTAPPNIEFILFESEKGQELLRK